MNDAEQMVHCYILKVGMILHTMHSLLKNLFTTIKIVELHNTFIVVTNIITLL